MRYVDTDKLIKFANSSKDKTIDANDIARFPTADVVEVVRCKDCKHYGKFGMKCNKLHLTPIESWRYCSFGERADT